MSLQSFALGFLLRTLWERDGRICGICLEPMALIGAHIDHIIPRSMGGEDTLENLQSAHAMCNVKKGGVNRIPRPAPVVRPVVFYWDDVTEEHRGERDGKPPANACIAASRQGQGKAALFYRCHGYRKMNSDLCVVHFYRRHSERPANDIAAVGIRSSDVPLQGVRCGSISHKAGRR